MGVPFTESWRASVLLPLCRGPLRNSTGVSLRAISISGTRLRGYTTYYSPLDGRISTMMWTNIVHDMDEYQLSSGRISSIIWTNFSHLWPSRGSEFDLYPSP